ncbi:uncharacterized protein LOC143823687 isoform X3 [Paroedura picta]|uniref:uncharacterized protein LOC143823687 isoform X3 n=1 Tax=Paroedura picta TaxID=143630 RepID=UPI004056213A
MEGPAWLLGHGRREPRGKGQMKQGKGKVHRSLSVRIWQPGQTLLLSQNYEAAQSKSKRVPCGGRSSGKQNKHQGNTKANALTDLLFGCSCRRSEKTAWSTNLSEQGNRERRTAWCANGRMAQGPSPHRQ